MECSHVKRTAASGLALAIGVAFVASLVISNSAVISATSTDAREDQAVPLATLLARGPFIDEVSAQVRVRTDGQPMHVMNVYDASELAVVRILIEPGVIAPWHTHSGPALIVNAGPGTLQTVSSHDCVIRDLPPGSAIVDHGGDHFHTARNAGDDDVVLYVTFLGVLPGWSPVIPVDPPLGCDPWN